MKSYGLVTYLNLLRINEWYKNVTVIIGIVVAIFTLSIKLNFNIIIESFLITLLACLISSANYSVNSMADKEVDKKHPIKKFRPLPSKKISVISAFIIMTFLFITSLFISYLIFNKSTTFYLFLLFLASLFYNVKPIRMKDLPYVDVLSESVNNPIRFLIGWSVLTDSFPNIVILALAWSLGSLLMTEKRLEELSLFKEKARVYTNVFKYYSQKSLNLALIIYILVSMLLVGVLLHLRVI